MKLRAYKYYLRPTPAQRLALDRIRRLCCELYNAGLQERRDAWRIAHKSISFKHQCAQLPPIKSERPDASVIHAQVLQNVLRRLNRNFAGFFRRAKAGAGRKAGYPRFKPHQRYDSFTFPQVGRGGVLSTGGVDFLSSGRLRGHGIPGNLKIKLHRPWEGRPKTATFKREGDRWYLILVCDVTSVATETEPLPATGLTAGIDVGLADFITLDVAHGGSPLSDGNQPPPVANPRHLRVAQASLIRAQQRLDHHELHSARWNKARVLLAKQHAHVANARRDFHHKLALDIVRQYDRIAAEALDIKGMLSKNGDDANNGSSNGGNSRKEKQARGLRRSIGDAAWGGFFSILAYKAESAGREFKQTPARGTTQECSGCGATVPKKLWERTHSCPHCGLVMSRDRNAARNVRQRVYGREAAIGEGGEVCRLTTREA